MARLPYLSRADLGPDDQDLLSRPITLHRCLVNSPGADRVFSALGKYIRYDAKLDPRLRELAILQIGWLARSPYEWSHHVKIGMEFGVTEADIHGLIAWNEGGAHGLDALTSLVLQGAKEVHEGGLSAESFAALQAHFDNAQMVDFTLTTAFYCAVVRTLASLAIDVEPEYQPYLDRFPLPA